MSPYKDTDLFHPSTACYNDKLITDLWKCINHKAHAILLKGGISATHSPTAKPKQPLLKTPKAQLL